MRATPSVTATLVAALAAAVVAADPPDRVGRLNLINGSVSLRPASLSDWIPAEPNRVLTVGDALWADADSRAEVHVASTAVRIAPRTELDVLNLDDRTFQARLAVGTATIRLRAFDRDQAFEIDTPNGAVSLAGAGDYRVDVASDGSQSRVTVRAGQAEVSAAGSSFEVRAQQVATVNGTDASTFDLSDVGPDDEWDEWCAGRDRREDEARSWRYVSREMPGYEDLDEYGRWEFVPGYGDVWYPERVAAGWAPYHTGHWVWTEPWGWTWVDEAPWGFAPYHYGRWAFYEGRWMWCPRVVGAAVVARPVFAPALVAFIGGPHWHLEFGFGDAGAVAWVPLGPGEVYRPAYHVSDAYVRQVNVTSVTNVTNITNVTVVNNTVNAVSVTNYRNATVPGAVVAMPQSAMSTGRPVASVSIPVAHQQLASAPVAGFAPPVAPTRQALVSAGAAGHATSASHVVAPPATIASRRVVAVLAPAAAAVPFALKEHALAASGGRPLSTQAEAELLKSTGREPTPAPQLVKSATLAGGSTGLKPARSGLVELRPVTNAAPNGFVARDAAVQHRLAAGPPTATPTAAGKGPGASREGLGSGVPPVVHTPTPTAVVTRRFVGAPVIPATPTPTPKPAGGTATIHTGPPPGLPKPPSQGAPTQPPKPTPTPTVRPVTQQVRRGPPPTPTPKHG